MSEGLEPLEKDVMAVLATARPIAPVPLEARERVWAAVAARAAMGPTGGGGSGPPGKGSLPAKVWVRNHVGVAIAGALIAGGVIGAAVRGQGEPRVVSVERVVTTSAATAPPPPRATGAWSTVTPPEVATPAPMASRPSPSTETTGQQLAAESALLDLARAAIARGESDHALTAIDRHAAAFPHGMLREEREALGVKALALAGRGDEARERAARFRARYPESLFLPALQSALRPLP